MQRIGNHQQLEFIKVMLQGHVHILEPENTSLSRAHRLMQKYSDLPMDLADASLVLAAEELGYGDILSTDRQDFKAYRWKNRKPFRNLLFPDD